MKILILQDDFPPYHFGGAGVIAGELAQAFVAAGQEVFVVTTVQDKKLAGKFSENGMTIYRIYSAYHERWRQYLSLYNWRVLPEVKKILAEVEPDVVHVHNIHYHLSYHSLKLARVYTDKVFVTTHDIMPFYQGSFTEFIDPKDLSVPIHFNYRVTSRVLMKALGKRFNPFHNALAQHYLSYTKKIIAVSDALKDALSQNGIKNISVIHNGIDLPHWQVTSEETLEYKKALGLADRDIVLFSGRLSGAKGGDVILQAMKKVVAVHPRATLLIAGKVDHYAEKMKKRAEALDLTDCIVFGGWLSEKEKAYAASAVVTVPSVCFDSFPNNNLEAFAVSRPVVSTCFGGSREIVKNGENGYVVNPFDIESLGRSITELLQNKEKADLFGRNGYELVRNNFSLAEVAKKYLAMFSL